MSNDAGRTALQLRSLVKRSGELELSLAEVTVPEPKDQEVLVRIEAAPINPSDMALLLPGADLTTLRSAGTPDRPIVTARIPERVLPSLTARSDISMPVGNEGAGVVVRAGAAPEAQALLGKTVAVLGGEMYGQYRCLAVAQCLLLPEGATAADGASCFVNPLTALGMVETMRSEGHRALVHTAAASNLGQMLQRICAADGIALVNIVRKDDQVKLLKTMGATYVCNTESETFRADLTDALAATGATIAFDAIGGGKLAGQILQCMELALNRTAKSYSRYGSSTHKQVYIYGGLDMGPTEFNRNFGMTWSMGGWLLTPFLQKVGPDKTEQLKQRVARELKTTFKSHYSKEVSLVEALQVDTIAAYGQRATGAKYLINPHKGSTT
jgi:NADPH:quinone reductase